MDSILETGLSGWIIFIMTAILGGGIFVRRIVKRRTRQSHINANGDVAGGDIFKGKSNAQNGKGSASITNHCVQENITAKGDVAGGDITKGDE